MFVVRKIRIMHEYLLISICNKRVPHQGGKADHFERISQTCSGLDINDLATAERNFLFCCGVAYSVRMKL